MHMAKAEPQLAQKWAEEAVKSGVADDLEYKVVLFPSIYGGVYPLVEICGGWGGMRLNASPVSMLKSLTHPYRFSLRTKNSEGLSSGQDVTLPAKIDQVDTHSGIHTGKG